eukprot:2346061-Pleurochrysis_carterae.AAC.4
MWSRKVKLNPGWFGGASERRANAPEDNPYLPTLKVNTHSPWLRGTISRAEEIRGEGVKYLQE